MDNEIQDWMKKVEDIKKGGMDLSKDEDLSIALMNLISIEEHLFFTAMKTNNEAYLQMLDAVRKLRINLLKKLVTNPKGEEWCISKHLLAASMRLMEVGTKELSQGKNEANYEANSYFKHAFELYSLFFAINMDMVKAKEINSIEINSVDSNTNKTNKNGPMQKISAIIKKILDCCKE